MIAILLFWRWEKWRWIWASAWNKKRIGLVGGPFEVYWSKPTDIERSAVRVWKHLVDWRKYQEAIG